jgi:hypothetical protein
VPGISLVVDIVLDFEGFDSSVNIFCVLVGSLQRHAHASRFILEVLFLESLHRGPGARIKNHVVCFTTLYLLL